MIANSFKDTNVKYGDNNIVLYKQQLDHIPIVLERVLQTTDGKRFTRKHKDDPREIWKLHELHQRLSATNATIKIALSQELAKMKVIDFDGSTQCLDAFDTKLEKFNETSLDAMPTSMATNFSMSATHSDSELRSDWATKETIFQSQTPPTTLIYDEYFDYLMFHAKQIEASIINNTTTTKANSSETDYLTPYSSSDPFYNDTINLTSYMVNQDVAMIPDILQCNQVLKEERPRLPQRARQESVQNELKIQNPT